MPLWGNKEEWEQGKEGRKEEKKEGKEKQVCFLGSVPNGPGAIGCQNLLISPIKEVTLLPGEKSSKGVAWINGRIYS